MRASLSRSVVGSASPPGGGSKQIPADYASPRGRAQAGVLCARDPAVWGDGIGIFGATFRGAFQ